MSSRFLVFEQDARLIQWAARIIPEGFIGTAVTIAVLYEGELIAVVLYYNCSDGNVEMAIASTSPKWASRKVLNAIFAYPFEHLQAERVTTLVSVDNAKSVALNDRLGFKREGLLRRFKKGKDYIVYGMLPNECRWL